MCTWQAVTQMHTNKPTCKSGFSRCMTIIIYAYNEMLYYLWYSRNPINRQSILINSKLNVQQYEFIFVRFENRCVPDKKGECISSGLIANPSDMHLRTRPCFLWYNLNFRCNIAFLHAYRGL